MEGLEGGKERKGGKKRGRERGRKKREREGGLGGREEKKKSTALSVYAVFINTV